MTLAEKAKAILATLKGQELVPVAVLAAAEAAAKANADALTALQAVVGDPAELNADLDAIIALIPQP